MSVNRLALIRRFLNEAYRCIDSGDPVQASEKLYKVAEESVKALAEALGLGEAREAEERGRWTVSLLEDAVNQLASKYGRQVRRIWDTAYRLHVDGFHEARLRIGDVKARVQDVEELAELARRVLKGAAPR